MKSIIVGHHKCSYMVRNGQKGIDGCEDIGNIVHKRLIRVKTLKRYRLCSS